MQFKLVLIFTSFVVFGSCQRYKGQNDYYGTSRNEISDRSSFRSLMYGKINKCCDIGEIFDLSAFGSSLTCQDGGRKIFDWNERLYIQRMFQHNIPKCSNLYQDFIHLDGLVGNYEGKLLYKNTVYHDYCVEFDATTDNWLVLACQFIPLGAASRVSNIKKNLRQIDKCCPLGQVYIEDEYGRMVCTQNHPSMKTFNTNKEGFNLYHRSPLSCANVNVESVKRVDDVELNAQQKLIYRGNTYTSYCVEFFTNEKTWVLLTCPDNTRNFTAPPITERPFQYTTTRSHTINLTTRRHTIYPSILPTQRPVPQKHVMHGIPKCCPRTKNFDRNFVCTDVSNANTSFETSTKILTLQYRYLHCTNQRKHVIVDDLDTIKPTTDLFLTYEGQRFAEYCIDFIPSNEKWVIEHCMEETTTPLNKCCPLSQDYYFANNQVYCVAGGNLQENLSIQQKFNLQHKSQSCGSEAKRFYVQQPNLLETSHDQVHYKNQTYSNYCIEYLQNDDKIILNHCPPTIKQPKILNVENQASAPQIRSFPKCCPFNYGVALDTETQAVGCYQHTLLDNILQQKYRKYEFVQARDCPLRSYNGKEIESRDLEYEIDREVSGRKYCIDEEVRFGSTHLLYC